MNSNNSITIAKRTIQMELEAVSALLDRIDDSFEQACNLILQCQGKVIVIGMGKSGHIGNKIAASLASTGTPAFFVHPGEASHGDMGMISPNDVVIGISSSGSVSEVVSLIPLLKHLQVPLISMSGNPNSPLAKAAQVNLDISVKCEACPLDLAPTSSTTVTLVMGDALAVALLEAKGFTAEDFAFSHPGGALGKRLLLKVADLMHQGSRLPSVNSGTLLSDALMEMTSKGLGMTTINNEKNELLGIFTDGDLRRALDTGKNIHDLTVNDVMSQNPTTIKAGDLAAKALGLMEEKSITSLVVTENQKQVVGVIHMHDLLKAGLV